jgi:TolA-binding protein
MQGSQLDPMLEALRDEPEPVDDITRARWLARLGPQLDAIDARRGPRSWRAGWLAFAGAAVAAAALVIYWPHHGSPVIPSVTPPPSPIALDHARLHPYVVAGDSLTSAATTLLAGRFQALDVAPGQMIRAEVDGDRLAMVGPSHVEVVDASASSLEIAASGTVLIDARAARPLVVRAGTMTVRAQDAVFAVSTTGTMSTVLVERGSIELGDGALHAGQASGPARDDLAAALREHVHAVAPGDDRGHVVAIAPGASATTEAGAIIGTGPLWARVGDTKLIITPPAEQLAPVGARAAEPPPAPARVPRPVRPTAHVTTDARAPIDPGAAAPIPPHAPDVSELYARADAALASGDHPTAESVLDELIARFPDAPQAAHARYDLARLARERGDLVRARDHLSRLLASAPPPALAEPARYLACRLEVESAHPDAAVRCFSEFRAGYPHSTHDAEVLAWLAGHARELGGCTAARALSAEYLGRYPQGAFASHARECETP